MIAGFDLFEQGIGRERKLFELYFFVNNCLLLGLPQVCCSFFRFIGGHLGFWALAQKGPCQNDVTRLFVEVFMFDIPIDIKYSKKNFNTSNI